MMLALSSSLRLLPRMINSMLSIVDSASTIRDKDERLEKRGKKGTMNEELKERVDRIRERRMGAARKVREDFLISNYC